MRKTTQAKHRDGICRVLKPFTEQQLRAIRLFLVPNLEGKGRFDNFVLANNRNAKFCSLHTDMSQKKVVTDSRLFDIWHLFNTVLVEVCGYNRNCILFPEGTPKHTVPLDPNSIEIEKELMWHMAAQLYVLIRNIDKTIPIVSNNIAFLNNAPKILNWQ